MVLAFWYWPLPVSVLIATARGASLGRKPSPSSRGLEALLPPPPQPAKTRARTVMGARSASRRRMKRGSVAERPRRPIRLSGGVVGGAATLDTAAATQESRPIAPRSPRAALCRALPALVLVLLLATPVALGAFAKGDGVYATSQYS